MGREKRLNPALTLRCCGFVRQNVPKAGAQSAPAFGTSCLTKPRQRRVSNTTRLGRFWRPISVHTLLTF